MIFLLLIYSLLTALSSCRECPCDKEVNNAFVCQPREATVTEFNGLLDSADYNINKNPPAKPDTVGVKYIPNDRYSIHTFEFPSNLNSSGSLPNDFRFAESRGVDKIPVVKVPLSGYGIDLPYYYALLVDKPSNEDMVGDILVDSVYISGDTVEPKAYLRLAGWAVWPYIAGLSSFPSESSKDFCDSLKLHLTDEAKNVLRDSLRQHRYAEGIARSSSVKYSNLTIAVVNDFGQLVFYYDRFQLRINPYVLLPSSRAYAKAVEQSGAVKKSVTKAQADLEKLLAESKKQYTVLEVKIGDILCYRAKNLHDFIVTIINIDQRRVDAKLKKRVSIMFSDF